MIIKSFKLFNESISGTELVGKHMGPNYPEQDNSPMKRVGLVDIVHSSAFNKTVTLDEYQTLYFDYLKIGGTPLQGFNKENLEVVLQFLNL